MRQITVTYSTIGQASPASVGNGGHYRWNGDPDKSEAARTAAPRQSAHKASAASATSAKNAMNRRLALYCAARDKGDTPRAAADKAGITTPKTVRKYEAQWLAAKQQQGGGDA